MRKLTKNFGVAAMLLGVCVAGSSVSGGVVLDEQFDYADGALNGVGGWVGNAGVNIVSGVASHPGVDGDIVLNIPEQSSGVVFVAMSVQQGSDEPAFDSYGGLGVFHDGGELLLVGKLWGVADEWALTGPDTMSGVDSSTGVFQTVLTKIDIDNDEISMWIVADGETVFGAPDVW